jgi:lysophospholipase L1-like esterase
MMAVGRRLAIFAAIVLAELAAFEIGLRVAGGSEAAPAFQRLFMPDPVIGYRLRPSTAVRFTTDDFSTDIRIGPDGVREDAPLGPKPPNERRIVVLGDSLVLAVQVPIEQTFCKQLESALNRRDASVRYRVVDAGVQGYGPVEEALFYERVASKLSPDLVLVVVFVANDAVEAVDRESRLSGISQSSVAARETRDWFWRTVRRSMVLQIVGQRVSVLRERFRPAGPPQPDRRMLTYATPLPGDIERGFEITREAIARIAQGAATQRAATAIVLMPARFQVDPDELVRMREIVEPAGYAFDADRANQRFETALRPLGLPMVDLLPVFRQAPNPKSVFFASTVHLTPDGHRIAAAALAAFLDRAHLLH